MPRQYLRKHLPSHESIRQHRYLQRHGAFLHHPNLWHLNRRSVSGGLAVGMFAGMVPGPLQMLTAALLAIPLRVNLPVALVTTFYTNPVTIAPLYLLAYWYGQLLVPGEHQAIHIPEFDWLDFWHSAEAFGLWALSLGKPLAIGLVALALTLAALGWLLAQGGWRLYVILAWRRRAALRRNRPAA